MIRRREFIAGLGGAAAWPLAAPAQQRMQVVGFLSAWSPGDTPPRTSVFAQALKEAGFVEGQNVAFESRFASGRVDQLPALAAELVRRPVDAFYVGGPPATIAAKAATATIPIVFGMGEDPVKEGIVASLNRPGGNATGFTDFNNQLMAKRFDLLRQAVPNATVIGFLVNPNNPNADPDTKDAQAAALARGLTLRVLAAANEGDFAQAFATISQERIGALLFGVEPFFWARASELVALAARHAVPALYDRSIFSAAGGLMSYSTLRSEREHFEGLYLGRVLQGIKPADLPVVQATRFEFVVNLKTAKTLGLEISPTLVALADRVIE
jgi:putative tryptophan/tyrosine transport system substrate-binding protein